MDNTALWTATLGEIELSLSRAKFTTWFSDTKLQDINNNCAVISTPNSFAKEWIENRCAHIIVKALQRHDSSIESIRCVLSANNIQTTKKVRTVDAVRSASSRKDNSQQWLKKGFTSSKATTQLNPRYTFEHLVIGQHNELACAAGNTVSEKLGDVYNPLFIYGDVGLGKTHLLQSIGNAVMGKNPNKNVFYTSSERFTSELIDSIHNNTISDFKRFYRKIDLLIIDDVQFLAGKEKTQDEFFHIFNFLYQQNKQIIISSDRPPHAIATLEERLRSRFEGGMIADISQPDFETRVAILQKKAEEKDIILPEDAARYIAHNIASNIRELEGALNKVIAICSFQQKIPSRSVVEDILAPSIVSKRPSATPSTVISVVAEHFSITPEDILGKVRKKNIVYPRQISMYLLRDKMSFSYPEIGTHCGGRDHTTVMHACRKIDKLLAHDITLRETIETLSQKIYKL